MYNTLVLYTFFALLIFFAALEFYKFKFYIRGKVVKVQHPNIGLENLMGSHFLVKLENGDTVNAEAERCTMCMGQFVVGDDVRLIRSKDKYMVHLPLWGPKIKKCKH